MLSKKDIENRKKLARKLLKALKKVDRAGLKILLRTNNTFGGVVYHVENVPTTDTPFGHRTVMHLLTPDGREMKEYAEYYDGSNLHPCIVFNFPDSPFLLTMRKAATMTDEDDDVEWVIVGARAESIAEMKADIIAKQQIIDELNWLIEQKQQTINAQKREILALRERIRNYERENEELSRKVVDYETMLRRLETLLEKHMAGELEATTAMKEILARADLAGKWEVMGAKERIVELLRKDKEISEMLQLIYGGNGYPVDAIEKKLEEVVERKLKELVPEITKSLQSVVVRETKGEGEEAAPT